MGLIFTPPPPPLLSFMYVFCEKLKHLESFKIYLKNPIVIYDSRLFVGS
jgi:hypothetical protein